MKFALKIALRFLKSGKGQTVFIILGIAVGVSVQVFIGLLIQGLQAGLIDKTIGSSPQISITSALDDKTISDWQSKVTKIQNTSTDISAVSVAADQPVFLKFDNKTESALIRGFEIQKSDKIYKFIRSIYKGSSPTSKGEVIIGRELQEKLGVSMGDKIKIATASGKAAELTVKGFYDLKVASINSSWLITNLETADGIFALDGKVTSIEMQVNTVFTADKTAEGIETLLSDKSIVVSNWKSQNAQLLSGLNGQSISSIMIQVFVLIAVLLGIASVLAISVLQKSRQIGILKAMGIKNRTASLVFLLQGFFLGMLGAVLGILLGIGLCLMFTKFALNPDGTPVIPLYLDYPFIMLSGLIALFASLLASLVPAIRSSKLNPIEVIRNG